MVRRRKTGEEDTDESDKGWSQSLEGRHHKGSDHIFFTIELAVKIVDLIFLMAGQSLLFA